MKDNPNKKDSFHSGIPGDDVELRLVPPSEFSSVALSRFRTNDDADDHLDPLEYFTLVGRTVRLKKPLDRDERDVSSVMFQVRH